MDFGSRRFVRLFASPGGVCEKIDGLGCTPDACDAAFRQTSGFMRSTPFEATSNRRMFVLSADLMGEGGHIAEPWRSVGKAHTFTLEQHLKFMMKQKGHADVLVAFDGRMRDARRCIAGGFADRQHLADAFIVYNGTCNRGSSAKDSLLLGDNTHSLETICIAFPMDRTWLITKDPFSKHARRRVEG